jgi:hypothetical protein
MGTEIAKQFERLGVTNYGGLHRRDGSDNAATGETIPGCNENATAIAPVAFWLSTPPHLPGSWKGQFTAIGTMWEGSSIPSGFMENIHVIDRVFVPSLQCLDLFRQWHDDVRYIPLGTDSDTWCYQPRETPTKEFRFLTAGAGPRKNCKTVKKAFYKVFGDRLDATPTPTLVWKARDAEPGKNIVPISSRLNNQEEVDLYASAHCYVSASMAEGWGLMPNQAIAQGLPTILPMGHGHQAFAHYGIPIGTHPITATAPGTFYGDNGEWWEPNFDELCEAMYLVYKNYSLFVDRAKQTAPMCAAEFNWQNTAEQLIFNLPEMWDEDITPTDWTLPPERLYNVRVITPKTFTINGRVFRYMPYNPDDPSTDYWEPADMKMRLGELGALHPSVISPVDMGVEAAKVAAERSDRTICPTCKQRLNTNSPLLELQNG